MSAVTIDSLKPHQSGSLRAFVDITLPSGLRQHGCTLLVSNGKPWVAPPSRPMVGKDGAVLTDQSGKRRYEPAVSFASREAQDRFSAAVVEAVRASHPAVLA